MQNVPRHIAIIMDGNGRWAQAKGLKRLEGHKKGVENVRSIVRACRDIGVEYLTLYAFSAENWQRPKAEVNGLMKLLESFLKQNRAEFLENDIRLHVIGDIAQLPSGARKQLTATLEATAHCTRHHLCLALNYGGRQEVLRAVNACIKAGKPLENYSQLAAQLYTHSMPDPDLLIRTSGEHRLSNFLPLQCAYTEFYFTDTSWPEFNTQALHTAIENFTQRQRRFGKTGEQV